MLIDPYHHPIIKDRLPWKSGRFVMGVGLRPIKDASVLDFATLKDSYLSQKTTCRQNNFERYYPPHAKLTNEELEAATEKILSFCPQDFKTFPQSYRDRFDEVVSNITEDVSIWKKEGESEWLASIHLCSPNHWAPEDKIGRSFLESHLPVPKIAPISQMALKLFDQSVERGLQERMAWGVATDTNLDHHPQAEFKGRSFNPEDPKLYARIERQTLFPASSSLLVFTIRTYFVDLKVLTKIDRELIVSCLESMDQEILAYKGLIQDRTNQINWLRSF